MAGGQQIDSAQGTVTQSAEVALVGEEVAVQDGTIVANTPADVAMNGAAATLAAGTAASAMLVSLRSRKVGGGSASRALTGSAIAASQGAIALTASKTPTGSSITASTGSFGKTRTRALTGSSATATPGTMGVSGQTSIFPLAVHSSGRYLTTAQGDGFLIHGDTPWSLPAQLTNAEIDTYIADRAARGFTTILLEAIVRTFTSQTPDYRTVDGLDPFTPMTDFSSPNNAYWNRVDYIVNACKAQNMVVMLNPAYLGFNGGSEGWMVQVNAASAASLQAYGVFLANRYTQGNIIWCLGGDYAGTTTERDKQWNIVTGMRTVRTTDIITAHGAPGDQAYTAWNSYTGYNLNNAYPRSNTVYTYCATEYARSPAKPFFMIEGWYEGEPDPPTAAQRIRLQAYQSLLSGACGHFYGNNPIWHFESPNTLYPYTGTWESNLNSTGAQDMERVKDLFNAYQWELLEPKTDTSLVTAVNGTPGALGSGDGRICPARASDASFALIYIPSSSTVTVNMAALTVGSVRARLYNPTTGVYTTVTGSPFTPSGTQNIASGGERVLVLDDGGNTVAAANASAAAVQTAINSANPGDTVLVPAATAGTVTWAAGSVVVNKAISLVGSGIGVTNITLSGTNALSLTKQASGIVRMRGFSFSKTGGGNNDKPIYIQGAWGNRPVVIEECRHDVSGSGLYELLVIGGVIFGKCSFYGGWDDSFITPKLAQDTISWTSNHTMGTADTNGESNIYIEDCYFYGGTNQGIDVDDGSRTVFRYNRCDYTSFNSHGLDTSAVGLRHFEVYNNQFRNTSAGGWTGSSAQSDISNQNWAIWIRGGTGVIFNNVIDDIANSFWGFSKSEAKFDIRAQQDNSGSTYGYFSDGRAKYSAGQGTYPRQNQLGQNWSNSLSNSVGINGGVGDYFTDPIYVWGNTGSGTSGGSFLGWANGGSWGSQTGYFNSGRDYVFGSTAKPGYTAYTYPHDLRTSTGSAF